MSSPLIPSPSPSFSPSPSPSPSPLPLYIGSSSTLSTLSNHRVPSYHLHRFVNIDGFVTPIETTTLNNIGVERCGLKEGNTWCSVGEQLIKLQQTYNNVSFKTLYFLRHAQGIHNEAESRFGTAEWDRFESLKDEYTDPMLTMKGVKQCQTFASILPSALAAGFSPSMVIVSPLLRTLSTETLCLHPTIDALSIPIISVEHARETLGEHTCDRRGTITNAKEKFPHVQFQFIENDIDPLWTTARETHIDELVRAQRFLDFIYSLKEDHIVLVNHSGMLTALARLFGKEFNANETAPMMITSSPLSPSSPSPSSSSSSSITNRDVYDYFHRDGVRDVVGIDCRHCELQPFIVARLPLTTNSISKL